MGGTSPAQNPLFTVATLNGAKNVVPWFITANGPVREARFKRSNPYHVHAGNWIREYRGIYRLANFPQGERPDLMLWYLRSRNREETPQGVYSHQPALSLRDLSDTMPAKLRMTVPLTFRRNSEIPRVLVLHYADIRESDIQIVHGVRVTKPMRTILDLLAQVEMPVALLWQTLQEGLQRGVIRRGEIAEARKRIRESKQLRASFEKVAA